MIQKVSVQFEDGQVETAEVVSIVSGPCFNPTDIYAPAGLALVTVRVSLASQACPTCKRTYR